MTEAEFIDSISCRFPYADMHLATQLINQACGISSNAVFAVVHELARVPRGTVVAPDQLQRLLSQVASSFVHPLLEIVLPVARLMIDDQELSVSEACSRMRQISEFPGQYAALAVVYFSCDDREGEADRLYDEIYTSWETA